MPLPEGSVPFAVLGPTVWQLAVSIVPVGAIMLTGLAGGPIRWCNPATLTTEERATRVIRGSDGSRFVPWAATVPGVPQKAEASRSAEEQPGASDDSYRQPAVPRSVTAGTDAFACRYLPGLRRRTGDVIEFLWNRNGTLPALRPPSTRFWRG